MKTSLRCNTGKANMQFDPDKNCVNLKLCNTNGMMVMMQYQTQGWSKDIILPLTSHEHHNRFLH
jgi:hypothetical protein